MERTTDTFWGVKPPAFGFQQFRHEHLPRHPLSRETATVHALARGRTTTGQDRRAADSPARGAGEINPTLTRDIAPQNWTGSGRAARARTSDIRPLSRPDCFNSGVAVAIPWHSPFGAGIWHFSDLRRDLIPQREPSAAATERRIAIAGWFTYWRMNAYVRGNRGFEAHRGRRPAGRGAGYAPSMSNWETARRPLKVAVSTGRDVVTIKRHWHGAS